MLTAMQFPFTEEYGPVGSPFRSKGPTAEACKRFYGRLGLLPWQDYDQHWNKMLSEVHADWKKKKGLPHDPTYGRLVWRIMRDTRVPKGRTHEGEYAFDFFSRKIVQDEAKVFSDSEQMELVQRYIREYWLIAIKNNPAYSYTQNRPFKVDMSPSSSTAKGDCSATPVQALNYAQRKSGIAVVDPAKQGFSGFGNTDFYEDDWPKIGAPYRIGDLAHFHSSRHVIQCIKEGNIDTAEWGSHGWEGSPELVRLRSYPRFPEEFMFVCRPQLIKED